MATSLSMDKLQKAKEKHERAETCEVIYDSGHKVCNKPTHVIVDDGGAGWERSFGPGSSVPRYTVKRPLCQEHSKQFDALNPAVSINDFVIGFTRDGKYLEGRERKAAKA